VQIQIYNFTLPLRNVSQISEDFTKKYPNVKNMDLD